MSITAVYVAEYVHTGLWLRRTAYVSRRQQRNAVKIRCAARYTCACYYAMYMYVYILDIQGSMIIDSRAFIMVLLLPRLHFVSLLSGEYS